MYFFSEEWRSDKYALLLTGHLLYVAIENECYRFTTVAGSVTWQTVDILRAEHEEADTRLVFHLHPIMSMDNQLNVSVRCNDTDVFVLLLYHVNIMSSPDITPKVWMDVGLSSNNTRRYINISQLTHKLDSNVLKALPGIHAFTGCDYTASFLNKGKVKPLEKNDSMIRVFFPRGENSEVSSDIIRGLEKFVCVLYSMPKLDNVNNARFAVFQQKYAPKKKISLWIESRE